MYTPNVVFDELMFTGICAKEVRLVGHIEGVKWSGEQAKLPITHYLLRFGETPYGRLEDRLDGILHHPDFQVGRTRFSEDTCIILREIESEKSELGGVDKINDHYFFINRLPRYSHMCEGG